MGSFALIDATTFVAEHNFTTAMNSLTLSGTDDELDVTKFGADGRERISGLEDVSASLAGFWESGTGSVDEASFSELGGTVQVATHSVDGTAGSTSYAYQARKFNYQTFGNIGEAMPFQLSVMGSSSNGNPGLVRGQLAATKADVSAIGAFGSAVNLGAVAADEFLYATFHVFTAGTTLSVKVESDDAEAFATPTDVTGATIGPLTTTGGTWMTRIAGPVTDTWFRFNATAVTGTFNVAGSIAVQ